MNPSTSNLEAFHKVIFLLSSNQDIFYNKILVYYTIILLYWLNGIKNRSIAKELSSCSTEIAAHSDATICEASDARYVDVATVLLSLQEGDQSLGHVELKSVWLVIKFSVNFFSFKSPIQSN